MAILAIVLSLVALAVSITTFWFEWWKPFGLSASLGGQLVYPPINTAEPFSMILPIVFRNNGARPGGIDGSYIRLLKDGSNQEYRLEAFMLVDPVRAIRLVDVRTESEGAEAILSLNSFVHLGKYESKEVGVHFKFPEVGSKRSTMFADPGNIPYGDYRMEFWCTVQGNWRRYAVHPVFNLREEQVKGALEGKLSMNIYAGLYDTAPGAPLETLEQESDPSS